MLSAKQTSHKTTLKKHQVVLDKRMFLMRGLKQNKSCKAMVVRKASQEWLPEVKSADKATNVVRMQMQ